VFSWQHISTMEDGRLARPAAKRRKSTNQGRTWRSKKTSRKAAQECSLRRKPWGKDFSY
jgi:hypothetical protein